MIEGSAHLEKLKEAVSKSAASSTSGWTVAEKRDDGRTGVGMLSCPSSSTITACSVVWLVWVPGGSLPVELLAGPEG